MATVKQLLALVDKFDWSAYHASTEKTLLKAFGEIVAIQGSRGAAVAGASFNIDDPFVQKSLTGYIGDRIVSLDETTKENVKGMIRSILDEGGASVENLGDVIGEKVRERFDGFADWRADRIARSETAIAYNYGNTLGYSQAGVTHVQVSDGDGDEACKAANGQVWTIEQALANPIEHPGCERDFSPILDD
jgi:hypothetical protein